MGIIGSKPKPAQNEQSVEQDTKKTEMTKPRSPRNAKWGQRESRQAENNSEDSDDYLYCPSEDDQSDRYSVSSNYGDPSSATRSAIKRSMRKVTPTNESRVDSNYMRRNSKRGYRRRHFPVKKEGKRGRHTTGDTGMFHKHLKKVPLKKPRIKQHRRKMNRSYTRRYANRRSRQFHSHKRAKASTSVLSISDSLYSIPRRKRKRASTPICESASTLSLNNSSNTSVLSRTNRSGRSASPSSVLSDDTRRKITKRHPFRRRHHVSRKVKKFSSRNSEFKHSEPTDSDMKRYSIGSHRVKAYDEEGFPESGSRSRNNSALRQKRKPPAEMVDKGLSPFVFPSLTNTKGAHRCLSPPDLVGNDNCPCVRRLLLPLMKNYTKKGAPKKRQQAKKVRKRTAKD